jgi:2,3-bisphosphoglycerate-independent phosphoglycerate mutase
MKYILIIGDGMADNPLKALGGKTPLEAAEKPEIDEFSKKGELGSVRNVPEGFPPGSDTAIMTIFGCAPQLYYSGRAPIEAAAQGIALSAGDAAMRCNNVTLSEGGGFGSRRILSHCGGGIEGEQANELVRWLFEHEDFQPLLKRARMELFPTISYRHIAVMRGMDINGLTLSPPHDHLGEPVADNLPSGCACAPLLGELLEKAAGLLETHPINRTRVKEGKLPANGIWFWAEGTAARLQNFYSAYGKTGAVISAVPLCHGIARLVGLDVIKVPGATGEVDTNYEGKVEAALEQLKDKDFVCVHLEGPDECTHCGDLPGKITAIERLSSRVAAPIERAMRDRGEAFRILILSDHKTLMEENGVHDGTPVPYLIYDSAENADGSGLPYTEHCGEAGEYIGDGTKLIERLFSK